ncbi:MAG: helix-turn-helix transcriptional regulator [Oscillochloris sp.]|jgi:transcriptional regulator with XRE-family HTH domain|nr:helix-turn-helix transcriptional regulator [Oscillochloris sp.]
MGELIDGQILRALRERHNWDQSALARHAEVDQSVISRLENGRQSDVKLSVVVALAHALGVRIDTLVISSTPPAEEKPLLAGELGAVIDVISSLSQSHQRQVAAILRGYLSAMPE